MQDLRFRRQGLEFRIWGWGSVFMAQGLGFRL